MSATSSWSRDSLLNCHGEPTAKCVLVSAHGIASESCIVHTRSKLTIRLGHLYHRCVRHFRRRAATTDLLGETSCSIEVEMSSLQATNHIQLAGHQSQR